MSITNGPNLGKMISAADGDAFGTDFRKLLRAFDVLVQAGVVSMSLSTPPGSPTNGARYIVGASPTGAWSGQAKSLAVWTTNNPASPSGVWEFYVPKNGWLIYNAADGDLYAFDGSAWNVAGGGGGGGTLAGDTDVNITSPANGDQLTYDSGSSRWVNSTPSGGGTLAGDTDVNLTSPANGDVLTFDSGTSKWINAVPSGGGGGGVAFPATQRRTALVASGGSTTFGGYGDTVAFDGFFTPTLSAQKPTSTRGAAVEFAESSSGSPWIIRLDDGSGSATNYKTGRNLKLRASVYRTATADALDWIYFGDIPGNYLTGPASNDTPAVSSGAQYAGFRFSNKGGSGTDAHWKAMSAGPTHTDQITDTGITPDTHSHQFAIEIDDVTPAIRFYIDGTLVATHTTNLPASGRFFIPVVSGWFASSAYNIGVSEVIVDSDI